MQHLLKTQKLKYLLLFVAGLFAFLIYLALPLFIFFGVILPLFPEAPAPTEPVVTQPPSNLTPNPFTSEDFVLTEDGFLQCLAADAVAGIDVSGFQGEIDWEAVADSGIAFVFIRIGGRGYGKEGALYADGWAQTYYTGAREAGLKIGAYFYSQAITPEEALEEAQFTLEQIKDWELDLPVVYDWEWVSDDARTADVDPETLTLCADRFCQTILQAGHSPMIYFNSNQGLYMMDLEQLYMYPFWLAMYDVTWQFPYRVDCWQYSCTGTVPGISTPVDLNLYFLPIPE